MWINLRPASGTCCVDGAPERPSPQRNEPHPPTSHLATTSQSAAPLESPWWTQTVSVLFGTAKFPPLASETKSRQVECSGDANHSISAVELQAAIPQSASNASRTNVTGGSARGRPATAARAERRAARVGSASKSYRPGWQLTFTILCRWEAGPHSAVCSIGSRLLFHLRAEFEKEIDFGRTCHVDDVT